jgi:anti-anti-sigma factor
MSRAYTEESALQRFECEAEYIAGGGAVITVRGELDMYTVSRLREVLREVASWRVGSRLVVDLTECGFMDSTALGVLITASGRAAAPLDIVAHVGALRVVTVSGLQDVFRIHKTREAALMALQHEMEASPDAA